MQIVINCHSAFIQLIWGNPPPAPGTMALEQIPKKDWYSVLGADPSADVSDLKQKYQKLILMVSPFMF